MSNVAPCTWYQAFGMRIASELILAEWPEANGWTCEPDISIQYTDLAEWRPRLQERKVLAHGGSVYFYLAGAAVFKVESGKHIWISPEDNADEELIRLCVTSTCVGALLLQKGMLPLHGSAVVAGDKAYAFVGHSGAGKSTLAAALVNRGFPFISDDIVAVCRSQDGYLAVPAFPRQRLWASSLDQLGMRRTVYALVDKHESKYVVPAASSFSAAPVSLGGVFEMVSGQSERLVIRRLDRLQGIRMLMLHTYRNFLIPALGLQQWQFSFAAALASGTEHYRLERPIHGLSAAQLAEHVVKTIRKEGERNGSEHEAVPVQHRCANERPPCQ
ncbi:aldolase [Xylanibacillus composti]|uniref:HPr kinase n=1 Tax=Xylanibacillus composti TaxID=1572762 RepID=A0A8J4H766_9BACL|nr:aldolase [Xylanibacillus composti]MDT9724520.1 aldolase [Xylanibacillus composti]GIQ69783.1 HPr kinase [Xylanibacillus composti]